MKIEQIVYMVAIAAMTGCVSAERSAEYRTWQSSDDGVPNVSLDVFETQYKTGWQERASEKKKTRLAKEAKDAAERERRAKERAEAERVRRAKEAAERAEKERLAMRTALYEKTVEQDLAQIRECYAKGNRYRNPFPRKRSSCNRDGEKTDWLSVWASPRLDISEADALAGEALLSEFGTKYMPNAYANFEKVEEKAIELQQVFNEEFAQPWTINNKSPKWNSFNKVLEKFVKVRTEYFICHDELCYYWLAWRFGILTSEDFAKIDSQKLAVHLLPENVEQTNLAFLDLVPEKQDVIGFATRYAPESFAIYQKMSHDLKELELLINEVIKQLELIDSVRFDRTLVVAVAKRNDLVRELNVLSQNMRGWQMDHRTTEKSSEDVAKCDHEMASQLKAFVDSLPNYIRDRALGSIIAKDDMISIPGCKYKMQRTEVTQLQWLLVMGDNPSKYKGLDHPVENISYADVQSFIAKVSELDDVKYRLPSEQDWEYACRAGSTSEWGRRRNGEEGPLDVMGWNQVESHHAVGQKEPNAWGLLDMHGNVSEWCSDLFKGSNKSDRVVVRGGAYCGNKKTCTASFRLNGIPDRPCSFIGFRLVSPQD